MTSDATTHWVDVPYDARPKGTGGIWGVELHDNEEVEWHFQYDLNGRTVTGYTIKTKTTQPHQEKS